MSDSFTERYTKKLGEYCDAPEVFFKASAYHLLSSLLGRFFASTHLPSGPNGARPNVWFLISSIPARMRRSTVQHYDKSVYETTLSDYYTGKTKKEKIQASMIDEGTPEGIADHIEESIKEYELDCFDIQSPEYGGALRRTKKGRYEEGIPTFLSKLYSGEGWLQLLSTRGKSKPRYIPPGLYVTMFCGMQEPYLYISESMIRQGLLRRLMICYVTSDMMDMDNWLPPIGEEKFYVWSELREFSNELTKLMKKYDKICKGSSGYIDIFFEEYVLDKINKLSFKCDKKLIDEEVTNLNIYQQGLWEHLSKLSMLEAISRGEFEERCGEEVIVVTKADYERARSFLDEISKMNEKIVESIVKSEEVKTEKRPLDRIYGFIERAGPKGITRKDLYRKANVKSKILEEYLSTLQTQGKITLVIGSGGARGPKPFIYKATKFLKGAS